MTLKAGQRGEEEEDETKNRSENPSMAGHGRGHSAPAGRGRGCRVAPPIALGEVRANGRLVTDSAAIELPYGENQLAVSFAGLSFRDRQKLSTGRAWLWPCGWSACA